MRLGLTCRKCGHDPITGQDYPMFENLDEIYAGVHAVRLLVQDNEYMEIKEQKDFVVCMLDLLEHSIVYQSIINPEDKTSLEVNDNQV